MKSLVSTVLTGTMLASVLTSCGDYQDAKSKLQSIAPFEDCIGLDYQTAKLKKVGPSWKIVDGPAGNHWAFDFGNKHAEAIQSLKVIKEYKVKHSCFVGRPAPSFQYLLNNQEQAPLGNQVAGEDCISFKTNDAQVKYFPGPQSWKIIAGNMWMVDFGNKKLEAQTALKAIKHHKFNQQCFVGRPNPSFKYWKRVVTIVNPGNPGIPLAKPDLGAYGFLTIGSKQVQWGNLITLDPSDAFMFSGGNPAFDLYYADKNYGSTSAVGYKNVVKLDGTLVSQQTNRTLAAGQKKDIHTQAYLVPSPGIHILKINIDGGNNILESNENNNKFFVKIQFVGFGAQPQPPQPGAWNYITTIAAPYVIYQTETLDIGQHAKFAKLEGLQGRSKITQFAVLYGNGQQVNFNTMEGDLQGGETKIVDFGATRYVQQIIVTSSSRVILKPGKFELSVR